MQADGDLPTRAHDREDVRHRMNCGNSPRLLVGARRSQGESLIAMLLLYAKLAIPKPR